MPLTDQKFNGVLSGGGSSTSNPDTRNRVQLVKPQQVMNSGASPAQNRADAQMPSSLNQQNLSNGSTQKLVDQLNEQSRQKVKNAAATPTDPQLEQYLEEENNKVKLAKVLQAMGDTAKDALSDLGYTYKQMKQDGTLLSEPETMDNYYNNNPDAAQRLGDLPSSNNTNQGMDAPSRAQLILQNIQNKIQNRTSGNATENSNMTTGLAGAVPTTNVSPSRLDEESQDYLDRMWVDKRSKDIQDKRAEEKANLVSDAVESIKALTPEELSSVKDYWDNGGIITKSNNTLSDVYKLLGDEEMYNKFKREGYLDQARTRLRSASDAITDLSHNSQLAVGKLAKLDGLTRTMIMKELLGE